MFNLVLYYSKGGSSLRVAEQFGVTTKNITEKPNLKKYEDIIIVCPTYGDEELPRQMEDYLRRIKVKNKNYAICELGNYFGFEKEFGALKIIKKQLSTLEWNLLDHVSLDSVPEVDWGKLKNWKEKLSKK